MAVDSQQKCVEEQSQEEITDEKFLSSTEIQKGEEGNTENDEHPTPSTCSVSGLD